jgi:hypothetical protein
MIYAILKNSGSIEYTNSNRAHTVNPLDVPGKLPSDEEAEINNCNKIPERKRPPTGGCCIYRDGTW